MKEEFHRYLVHRDRLVRFTDRCATRVPDDLFAAVAETNSDVRYGDRVPSVSIRALYAHMAVTEQCWAEALVAAQDGQVIGIPNRPDLVAALDSEAARTAVPAQCAATLAVLTGLPSAALSLKVNFVGRQFTGMGFLWAGLQHRAYHMGQMDLAMRQAGIAPPDFFDFEPRQLA